VFFVRWRRAWAVPFQTAWGCFPYTRGVNEACQDRWRCAGVLDGRPEATGGGTRFETAKSYGGGTTGGGGNRSKLVCVVGWCWEFSEVFLSVGGGLRRRLFAWYRFQTVRRLQTFRVVKRADEQTLQIRAEEIRPKGRWVGTSDRKEGPARRRMGKKEKSIKSPRQRCLPTELVLQHRFFRSVWRRGK